MEFSMEQVDALAAQQESSAPAKTEKKTFSNEPVEAGVYQLVIKKAPRVVLSGKGNQYLSLFLTHADGRDAAPVYARIMGTSVGAKQLAEVLQGVGYSEAELRTKGFGFKAANELKEAREFIGAVISAAGQTFDGEALVGKTLNVYLKKELNDVTGKEENIATSFNNTLKS